MRDRLVRFYSFYNPSCVNSVDALLASYAGKEEELFRVLETKYGPEPPHNHDGIGSSSSPEVNADTSPQNATARAGIIVSRTYSQEQSHDVASAPHQHGRQPSSSAKAGLSEAAASSNGAAHPLPSSSSSRQRLEAMFSGADASSGAAANITRTMSQQQQQAPTANPNTSSNSQHYGPTTAIASLEDLMYSPQPNNHQHQHQQLPTSSSGGAGLREGTPSRSVSRSEMGGGSVQVLQQQQQPPSAAALAEANARTAIHLKQLASVAAASGAVGQAPPPTTTLPRTHSSSTILQASSNGSNSVRQQPPHQPQQHQQQSPSQLARTKIKAKLLAFYSLHNTAMIPFVDDVLVSAGIPVTAMADTMDPTSIESLGEGLILELQRAAQEASTMGPFSHTRNVLRQRSPQSASMPSTVGGGGGNNYGRSSIAGSANNSMVVGGMMADDGVTVGLRSPSAPQQHTTDVTSSSYTEGHHPQAAIRSGNATASTSGGGIRGGLVGVGISGAVIRKYTPPPPNQQHLNDNQQAGAPTPSNKPTACHPPPQQQQQQQKPPLRTTGYLNPYPVMNSSSVSNSGGGGGGHPLQCRSNSGVSLNEGPSAVARANGGRQQQGASNGGGINTTNPTSTSTPALTSTTIPPHLLLQTTGGPPYLHKQAAQEVADLQARLTERDSLIAELTAALEQKVDELEAMQKENNEMRRREKQQQGGRGATNGRPPTASSSATTAADQQQQNSRSASVKAELRGKEEDMEHLLQLLADAEGRQKEEAARHEKECQSYEKRLELMQGKLRHAEEKLVLVKEEAASPSKSKTNTSSSSQLQGADGAESRHGVPSLKIQQEFLDNAIAAAEMYETEVTRRQMAEREAVKLQCDTEKLQSSAAVSEHHLRLARARCNYLQEEAQSKDERMEVMVGERQALEQQVKALLTEVSSLKLQLGSAIADAQGLDEATQRARFNSLVEEIQKHFADHYAHRLELTEAETQEYYLYAKKQISNRDAVIAEMTTKVEKEAASVAEAAAMRLADTFPESERRLAQEVARLQVTLATQRNEHQNALSDALTKQAEAEGELRRLRARRAGEVDSMANSPARRLVEEQQELSSARRNRQHDDGNSSMFLTSGGGGGGGTNSPSRRILETSSSMAVRNAAKGGYVPHYASSYSPRREDAFAATVSGGSGVVPSHHASHLNTSNVSVVVAAYTQGSPQRNHHNNTSNYDHHKNGARTNNTSSPPRGFGTDTERLRGYDEAMMAGSNHNTQYSNGGHPPPHFTTQQHMAMPRGGGYANFNADAANHGVSGGGMVGRTGSNSGAWGHMFSNGPHHHQQQQPIPTNNNRRYSASPEPMQDPYGNGHHANNGGHQGAAIGYATNYSAQQQHHGGGGGGGSRSQPRAASGSRAGSNGSNGGGGGYANAQHVRRMAELIQQR